MSEINPQNPLLTGLLGVLSGGALSTIISRLLPSKKETLDDATAYRAELRGEIIGLQTRQDMLEKAVQEWQERYWGLFADYSRLKIEHETLQREMLGLQAHLGVAPPPVPSAPS